MEVLRRLARKLIWWSCRVWQARAMPRGWPYATADLPPGISEVSASDQTPRPKRPDPVTYPLDLDIGEVADGYHLIVRSIALTDQSLLFDFAFDPERAEAAEIYPSMNYGADVSPPGWNQACMDAEEYERPVPKARYAWFDFFLCDYDWRDHPESYGQPGGDYERNRIARLIFDLKTGDARIEK